MVLPCVTNWHKSEKKEERYVVSRVASQLKRIDTPVLFAIL
jgi:hypothetical protein